MLDSRVAQDSLSAWKDGQVGGSEMRLKDKVAVVTGGARGIGSAYALALASEGAKVVICDIRDGTSVVESIAAGGGTALFLDVDVADEAATSRLVERTVGQFGHIDILVNNAAVFVGLYPLRDFTKISVERWDKVMAVNLRGTFLCCKAVVPVMRDQQYGRIINISSQVVWRGLPGFLDYTASKAGVIGLTRALAREVGKDGITVNCVAPGYTQSEGVIQAQQENIAQDPSDVVRLQAIPRPEVPEDLVGTIVFLASDDAAFITGQAIVVDGGLALN